MTVMNRNWNILPSFYPEFDLERAAISKTDAGCARRVLFRGNFPETGKGKGRGGPPARLGEPDGVQRLPPVRKMCPERAIRIVHKPGDTSHGYWYPGSRDESLEAGGKGRGVLLVGRAPRYPRSAISIISCSTPAR
jgi:hypothetical protein